MRSARFASWSFRVVNASGQAVSASSSATTGFCITPAYATTYPGTPTETDVMRATNIAIASGASVGLHVQIDNLGLISGTGAPVVTYTVC